MTDTPDIVVRTDRETLELVAKGYNELLELQRQQQATQAKMIRACLAAITRELTPFQRGDWQLSRKIVRERKQALDGLVTLAEMLEKQSVRSSDTIEGTPPCSPA